MISFNKISMVEQSKTNLKIPTLESPGYKIWGSLGWLRFGLAVIVASSHLRLFYGVYVSSWDPVRILGSFNGMAAVIGFLLVSGFSICHSLVQTPKGYARRRLLRIYPLYLVAIVLSVCVGGYWLPGDGDQIEPREVLDSSYYQIIVNALLLQGALAKPLFNNLPLWTLSLEWWLYMLAPLMVAMKPRSLAWLLVILAFGNLSWIAFGKHIGYYTHTLAFSNLWFLGVFWVLGFWFYLNKGKKTIAPLVLVLGVWFLTGLNRESLDKNYQVTLVLTCLILIYGAKFTLPGWLDGLGRFFGNVSYPLYLIHLPVFALLNRYEALHHAWLMLALVTFSSIFAHMMIEKPLYSLFAMAWNKVTSCVR